MMPYHAAIVEAGRAADRRSASRQSQRPAEAATFTAVSERCPACGAKVRAAQTSCEACLTELSSVVHVQPPPPAHSAFTQLRMTYVGGLPSHGSAATGDLLLDADGVRFRATSRELDPSLGVAVQREVAELGLRRDEIKSALIEGPDQIEKRVTLTRLVLVGILAFGIKKEVRRSYLVVECVDGRTAVFESHELTPLELRSRVSKWLQLINDGATPPSGETQRSPAERLRDLAGLHADGLVSDEEYAAKRMEILSEL